LTILKSISKEIKENWDETYMDAKYNLGLIFQGKNVDKKKTRKSTQERLPMLQVEQLIKIFENKHIDIRKIKVMDSRNSTTATKA
jgi:hypothetical protein